MDYTDDNLKFKSNNLKFLLYKYFKDKGTHI